MSSTSSDDDEAPQVVHFAQGAQEEKERRKLGVKPVAAARKKKIVAEKVKNAGKKSKKEPEIDSEALQKYKFDDEEEEQGLQERFNQFERLERKSNFIDINPVLPAEREVKLGKNVSAVVLKKIPTMVKPTVQNLREATLQRHNNKRRPLNV